MKFYLRICFAVILIIFSFDLQSQVTKIMGTVTDKKSNEPIPFVTITFKGTQIGTTTDFNGNYSLEIKKPGDSLFAACLGYVPVLKKVVKNKFQVIDFELASISMTLQEVVIKPGRNPAEVILEKIIKNKKYNDRNRLDYYQYEVYNKIQFDANNISDKLKKFRLLKHFKFIFDYVDTSTVNGKTYLPVLITEALSDYYYRKSPKSEIEIIKATKNSGIENKSISQFLGNMYLNINIYDNFINIFDRNFVSPISNFGLGFYKYYLIDSAKIGNQWCYQIMFKPRRKQELTFSGDMWVHDTTYAVRKVKLRIAEDANINFINDLVISQNYELINKQYWMLTKEKFTADFNIFENSRRIVGFYGNKTTSYSNFVFNTPKEDKFYSTPINIQVSDIAYNKDEDFWEKNRHDTLDKKERGIYKMVDSIKNVPIFKTYVDIVMMITLGYYEHGDFEWGPYFSLYSYNTIEGNRFRLGFRTSNKFSTTIMPEAYLAYGTLDQKFKYGGGLLYMFNNNPRRDLGVYYKNDVEQLGESRYAFYNDNILASFFRKSPFNKLTMVEEYKAFYEHEWFTGFSNTINFYRRNISAPLNLQFKYSTEPDKYSEEIKKSIITSEVRLDMRFAYKEKYLRGNFVRISAGTYYPVLNVQYSRGIKDLWGGDNNYQRLVVGLEHWYNVRSYGWSKYILEAGKIWSPQSQLLFPLLKLHEGNETLSFDPYAFNMMNYYEFVSNEWVSFYYTHHFDGYFLNHIPLMRKLKWREVVWGKGVIGRLDNSYRDYNSEMIKNLRAEDIFLNTIGKPYYEAGVAIENIFKIIRIDAMWRLSYLNDPNHPKAKRFGMMATLQFIM